MRIGVNGRFLAARHGGGVQRFAFEVTARLTALCEVTVFVPRDGEPPDEWRDRVPLRRGRLRGHAWEQLELPLARGIDVLFNPANTAPLFASMPWVLMLHDVFPLVSPRWYSGWFAAAYRVLLPAVAPRAARVLTTSAWSAEQITAALRIDRGRVEVVPQGLAPFDRPLASDTAATLLERLGVCTPYVLVAGGGDARKNTPFAAAVLNAYAAIHGTAPRLVQVGTGPRRVFGRVAEEPPAAAGRHGVRLGRVTDEQLHALYTQAAAVLCPSLAEGFGRVPLEALGCGAPCIAADGGAAPEILQDSPARVLPLEIDAWVAALREILVAGERVPEGVRAGLRRRWSWDAAAASVLEACVASAPGVPLAARAGAS